ncbi:hypothetical protein CR513_19150, partial [Mucuna pruriens]
MITGKQKQIGHLREHFVSGGLTNQFEDDNGRKEESRLEDYIFPCLDRIVLDIPLVHLIQNQTNNVVSNHLYENKNNLTKGGEDSQNPLEELKRLMSLEDKVLHLYQEGTTMHPNIRTNLIRLLIECVHVFAWSYQDMPSLDNDIVEHKIPLKPNYPPIK